MKRIFGFLSGVLTGAGITFVLQRWLESRIELSTKTTAEQKNISETPAPETALPKTSGSLVPEGRLTNQGTRYTIRRSNPKPEQASTDAKESSGEDSPSIVGEPEGRHVEPVAATESSPAATSPRSELTEQAIPGSSEVKPVEKETTTSDEGGEETTDDFTLLKDIGPATSKKLQEAGIASFEQLAALSTEELEKKTGISAERINRARWQEQAAELASKNETDNKEAR
ncbi:MAG TPA: helix-hairpin-helix domain-containing protein [Chloroflexia bacterium]|nr:helix-hairpin-helix domain-containing protein [Chloroflexia bacterium]